MARDFERITLLAYRYATVLVRKELERLGTVFRDDATAVLPGSGELDGLSKITEYISAALTPLDASQHMITNVSPAIDGDRATLVSYLRSEHVRDDAPGGPLYTVGGVYRDEVSREPEGWRITRRELSVLWAQGNRGVFGWNLNQLEWRGGQKSTR